MGSALNPVLNSSIITAVRHVDTTKDYKIHAIKKFHKMSIINGYFYGQPCWWFKMKQGVISK